MVITTLRVRKETAKMLRKLEAYPRETFDELLTRLINEKKEAEKNELNKIK